MKRPVKFLLGTLITLLVLGGLALAASFLFLDLVVDMLWYRSLGYFRLLMLKMGYRYLVFTGVTLLFFLVIFLNFWMASRYLGVNLRNQGGVPGSRARNVILAFRNGSMKVYTPLSLLLAIPMALPLYREWERALMFFFGPETGIRDALFNLDISYYLFSLPVFTLLQGRLILTLILLFISLVLLYAAEMKVLERDGHPLYLGAKIHLSLLVLLIFAVQVWGYVLEAHMLQYSTQYQPKFYGPGFSDIRIKLPLIWASGIFVFMMALSLISYVHIRRGVRVLIVFSVLAVFAHLGRNWRALPAAVDKFYVVPNAQEVQREYIRTSIQATLAGYGLENVERRDYLDYSRDARIPELGRREELESIPLWDYELLADVFHEEQVFRPYFRFSDVDTARYRIQGKLQQVYLAGREINTSQLPERARDWFNTHLKYTHGYGAVMIPAAQRGEEDMRWHLRDMPPFSETGVTIENPAIYYGTGEYTYVIAPNRSREFHYPRNNNAPDSEAMLLTDYSGSGDVPFRGFIRRALFAAYFRDINLFITQQIVPDSRLLFRRNILERIQTLTPFLKLDRDPYLVVTDDRMFWILDAYTTSNWYPNSLYDGKHNLNYIRNSVKIVVDAYNGDVHYYLADPSCPIARAYRRIYPGLLRSMDEMPENLQSQIRYPRDIFDMQMHVFMRYHQTNPDTFFNDEDLMEFAEIQHRDTLIRMEPYYLTLNLIDFDRPDFFLMTPLLPHGRNMLRALVLAGSDDRNYGRIIVYDFPRDSRVFGPSQINALIDQHPPIAQAITLWNQQGTEVKRGKMIVLPLGKHITYIQPLYLEATGNIRIPQLMRVIVSAEGRVVMDTTLERAVERLRGLLAPRASAEPAEPVEPSP